jgi:hypothetical protein
MLTQTATVLLSGLAASMLAASPQQTSTFVYDAQGRLTANALAAASGNSNLSLYAFDNANNRVSLNSSLLAPRANANQMVAGEVLLPTQAVVSADAQSRLELRSSGVLVISCNGTDQMTFAAPNGQGAQLAMQGDGNLVLYTPSYTPLWAAGVSGFPGAYAVLQDDGNLVIYQGSNPVWASYTFC